MAHDHVISDSDSRFVINPITRAIKNEYSRKVTLIQYDHNSERLTFECPRTIEGHDMSKCNMVTVHYINVDSATKKTATGMYTVDDMKIDSEDPEKVICTWLVSGNATQYAGSLNFLVRYSCIEDETVLYSWNTALFGGISVGSGLDAGEEFEKEYVDIIEQWKESVISGFETEFTTWKDNTSIQITSDIERWKQETSDELDADFNNHTASWNNALAVERARIDQIIALPEGSTTGDAELIDARIDSNGVEHDNVGDSVRTQISRLSESKELFNSNGYSIIKGGFTHGKIDNEGNEYADKYRVKSCGVIQYDRDIQISVSDGFRYVLHFYDDVSVHASESGWITNSYTIAKETLFRVVIARTNEDTTEIANIEEFVNALCVSTVFSEALTKLETTKKSLQLHESGNNHLISLIKSNNLVDPSEIIDGGYYEYNNGNWKERSDISTTGFISCIPGQTYYCGINKSAVRGGNCTFWNIGGEYISGINVTNGADGFTIPDDDRIKYFRISFYTTEKSMWHVNLGEYKDYDEFKQIFLFDNEIETPSFDSSKSVNTIIYTSTYNNDVSVIHRRNTVVGTSYKEFIINRTKYDGTKTFVSIASTSNTSNKGDSNNRNVIEYAKEYDFLHVINGGIYMTESGESDGITIIDGIIIKGTGVEQFENEQYVIGITESGDFKTYINETAESILSDGSVYAITGFVPLIQSGIASDESVLSVCPHYNIRHPRQIIGALKSGEYFTFCCDGRTTGENGMTLYECIETIQYDMDAEFAFCLDGGGSTQSVVGKKQINRVIDGRSIPNIIIFK